MKIKYPIQQSFRYSFVWIFLINTKAKLAYAVIHVFKSVVSFMVSPQEFFMGFSRFYNYLGVAFEESIATNTNRIVSYVDSLGRMLGHRIFSELTCSNLFKKAGKKCPLELRRRRPDVCWGDYTKSGIVEFELVLESEQSMKEDKIKEKIIELLLFPAKLKILYCAHKNPKRIIEMVLKIAEDKRQQSIIGELLLISARASRF